VTDSPIQALIIDDEPLAREYLLDLLKEYPDIRVAGEASNGVEALELIGRVRPDLLFLDIQMPEMDGFELLTQLDPRHMPHIIFVTAHDQYAVKAFEVHALDYLLKPFDPPRFQRSVDKAVAALRDHLSTAWMARLKALTAGLEKGDPYPQRLWIKGRGRIYFVDCRAVHCIVAAGNYVALHTDRDEHLMRGTMHSLEERLDPERFVRVHRSAIVNLDHVTELQPLGRGEYRLLLANGRRLPLGRKYRNRILDRF
jgi:two-component system LytT family response regulator